MLPLALVNPLCDCYVTKVSQIHVNTRSYRTHNENSVFAILRASKADFGHKKGDQDLLSIPLCG